MNRKVLVLLPILCLSFIFATLPAEEPQPVYAAAGTTGKISVGVASVVLNTPVAIKCYAMTASGDYSIDIDSTNWINWTNGASETSKVFYKTFDSDDVTNDMIKVQLMNGAYTALDTIYLYESEPDEWLPTDFIFDLFVPILIAVVLVAVVVAFRARKSRR